MECGYVGPIRAKKPSVTIRFCTKLEKNFVPKKSDMALIPGAEVETCEGCHFFKAGPELPVELIHLNCPHRGGSTGKFIDCNCSVDRTIYSCGIKGTCVKKLPIGTTAETFGDVMQGVTICKDCEIPRQPERNAKDGQQLQTE